MDIGEAKGWKKDECALSGTRKKTKEFVFDRLEDGNRLIEVTNNLVKTKYKL